MYPFLTAEDRNYLHIIESKRGIEQKYNWYQMSVGTDFFIPDTDRSPASIRNDSRPKLPDSLLRKGWKIKTRKAVYRGQTGLHIVRVE